MNSISLHELHLLTEMRELRSMQPPQEAAAASEPAGPPPQEAERPAPGGHAQSETTHLMLMMVMSCVALLMLLRLPGVINALHGAVHLTRLLGMVVMLGSGMFLMHKALSPLTVTPGAGPAMLPAKPPSKMLAAPPLSQPIIIYQTPPTLSTAAQRSAEDTILIDNGVGGDGGSEQNYVAEEINDSADDGGSPPL